MNKHNFTPFTESLPEQGRWILVTDDVENFSRLWLIDRNEGYLSIFIKWKAGKQVGHTYRFFDKDDKLICRTTHWRYAIEEGG